MVATSPVRLVRLVTVSLSVVRLPRFRLTFALLYTSAGGPGTVGRSPGPTGVRSTGGITGATAGSCTGSTAAAAATGPTGAEYAAAPSPSPFVATMRTRTRASTSSSVRT